jgi:RNA polymerase sigma-70 factor (ECF subfamily)
LPLFSLFCTLIQLSHFRLYPHIELAPIFNQLHLSTGLPNIEDKDLYARIADGDEAAFAVLFNHYYPRLRPFVLKFTASAHGSEEILQETFIRVWLSRDQLPDIENLPAWLYTIASRQCLTALRKDLNTRKKLDHLRLLTSHVTETPADTAQLSEITRLVHEAITLMPPARQRIYRMSREEGLKPAEIAKTLSLSVSTVKNVLVTALREIRDHLALAGIRVGLLWLLLHFF